MTAGRPFTRAPQLAALIAVVIGVAACQQSPAPSPRVAAFSKLPDWSGLWEPNVFVGEGIGQSLSAEGLKAGGPILGARMPFSAEWQAKFDAVKKERDDFAAADPDHPPVQPYPPCSSPPFLIGIISPTLSQWRITPEEVTFIDTIGFVRHIYTDGRAHPPADELWATKMGDSVGHWEGDTLIVDTVAIKPTLVLFSFLPLKMSDQLHFVERIRMVDGKEIENQLTVEDPVALTELFKITLKYARVTDATRMIDEAECDQVSDRNPVVNGRFTSITER